MQFAGQIEEHILHTGQHYDDNMSEVFFRELGIPEPDYNLHVGSGTRAEQIGKMIREIEAVLGGRWNSNSSANMPTGHSVLSPEGTIRSLRSSISATFDGLIVYGDTNSTIAGALAGCKMNVPVYHVEAGLRSYNRTMPEEINRFVCDHLSSVLFVPTQTGMKNLKNEGFPKERIVLSGDVMYDNALYFAPKAVLIVPSILR